MPKAEESSNDLFDHLALAPDLVVDNRRDIETTHRLHAEWQALVDADDPKAEDAGRAFENAANRHSKIMRQWKDEEGTEVVAHNDYGDDIANEIVRWQFSMFNKQGSDTDPPYDLRHYTAQELQEMKRVYVAAYANPTQWSWPTMLRKQIELEHRRGSVDKEPAAEGLVSPANKQYYSDEYDTVAHLTTLAHAWKTTVIGQVTEDMVGLMQQSMDDVPLVRLDFGDLPFNSGCMFLEAPLLIPDREGWLVPIRAMSWHGIAGPGIDEPVIETQDAARPDVEHPPTVILQFYRDPREIPIAPDAATFNHASGYNSETREVTTEDPPNIEEWVKDPDGGLTYTPSGEELEGTYLTLASSMANLVYEGTVEHVKYEQVGFVVPHWETVTFLDVGGREIEERHEASYLPIIKAFHNLWGLMMEQVPIIERTSLDRATRRRAERDGVTAEVITVRLRSEYQSNPNRGKDFKGALSCRFLVSGHWRRLRDKQTGEVVRKIRIKPHVKGPEDAPFKFKNRIVSLQK